MEMEMDENLYNLIYKYFNVYEVRREEDEVIFLGEPLAEVEEIYRGLFFEFAKRGYEISIRRSLGEFETTVKRMREKKEKKGLNLILFIATVFTTMFAGVLLYGINPFEHPLEIYKGIPYTIAIMGVLGTHEMGHYLMSRRKKVNTSLPFFIPFLPPLGTLGAVISMRGAMPDRRSLFDISVAGPFVGLILSIIVAFIGLSLPSPDIPQSAGFKLGIPPLFRIISYFTSYSGGIINPIAFAGWVGMLATFINLLPVGQLDGGHIARAMIGRYHKLVSTIVPILLIMVGIFMTYFLHVNDGGTWIFWGFLTWFFSMLGSSHPIDDKTPLDKRRVLFGIFIYAMGLICISPVPISYI